MNTRTRVKHSIRQRVSIGIVALVGGAISLFSLPGCTGETRTPSGRAVSTVSELGTAQLRRDAEAVAIRVTTQEVHGLTKIPENLWLDSFRKFRPEEIYWGSDRLTIVTSKTKRYENGIVVYFPSYPDDSLEPGDFVGGGSGRADYKIDSGVYWYWRKIRSDAAVKRKLQEMETQTNGLPNQKSDRISGQRVGFQFEQLLRTDHRPA